MTVLNAESAALFAATVLFAALFLIARIGKVRQSLALAFALLPLLLVWAAHGLAPAVAGVL